MGAHDAKDNFFWFSVSSLRFVFFAGAVNTYVTDMVQNKGNLWRDVGGGERLCDLCVFFFLRVD